MFECVCVCQCVQCKSVYVSVCMYVECVCVWIVCVCLRVCKFFLWDPGKTDCVGNNHGQTIFV